MPRRGAPTTSTACRAWARSRPEGSEAAGAGASRPGRCSTAPLAGSTSTTPETFWTGEGRNPLGIQLCASQLTRSRPPSVSADSASEALCEAITTSPSTESPSLLIWMPSGKRTGASTISLPSAGRRKRTCSVFRCAGSGAATASHPARAARGHRPSRVVQRRCPAGKIHRDHAAVLDGEVSERPARVGDAARDRRRHRGLGRGARRGRSRRDKRQRRERAPHVDQSVPASKGPVPESGGRQTLRPIVPSTNVRLEVQLDSLSTERRTLQSGLSAQIRKQ